MQDSAAESYAHLIRDRVADIPLPPEYQAPDILIGDGCRVDVAPATAARPKPVLTVGERLAVEGPRDVVRGLIAIEAAAAHLDTPEQRAAERAGAWAPGLLKASAVVAVMGLLFGSPWLVFLAGIGGIAGLLGIRARVAAADAVRQHLHAADELAASWVGRQAVVDSLRWYADRAAVEQRGALASRFASPTILERLADLGA